MFINVYVYNEFPCIFRAVALANAEVSGGFFDVKSNIPN
ncbi:hypothetical protein EDO6_05810 [Paenibacillus xylanexedens]|nr:hypothetical protein EDO6_05810 [Paenibacillus xylanexedens]